MRRLILKLRQFAGRVAAARGRWVRLFALALILSMVSAPLQAAKAQPPQRSAPVGLRSAPVGLEGISQAQQQLGQMTPEEKVGQLFLVSFNGTDASETSQIYQLITRQHVGGVVLSAGNDNFTAEDTARNANQLITALQKMEWDQSQNPPDEKAPHSYIPLFVGISQEGGGSSSDQILNGLFPLPSQMALGATWDRSLAQQTGAVMGHDLSRLGFNLYLGLMLDVLAVPDPILTLDIDTRVFGGDPYWVGELSKSYLSGLQAGAEGRMAVIAKHFPGKGAVNRSSSEEIPTVRRSLEELKSIELPPFLAVTGASADLLAPVDGLLVSHIRYQGFQGNIRATTRPISFDQQALSQVMSLPVLTEWRKNGGLMVSDNLGTLGVRRFYDPDLKTLSSRLVARDAFLAGNDLLYMGDIVSSDAPDNFTSVSRTLEFFAQRYNEDSAFAKRVDEAVLRILNLKYKIYGKFDWQFAAPPVYRPEDDASVHDLVFNIARQSATLISPSLADFSTVLPEPPNPQDYILFLTDVRNTRQCSTCPDQPILSVAGLQAAVQNLYGPLASGLVTNSHLSSFSLEELAQTLDDKAAAAGQDKTQGTLTDALSRANWIVISALDLPEGSTQITTLRRFFSEKQSILNRKKVILFSFSAPYYLDATDISKLTAYYGLYSPSEPFVNVAARLLFQEIPPAGSLPVSVLGIGYDLITATTPDPGQVISLSLDSSFGLTKTPEPTAAPGAAATLTPKPTIEPVFRVGDTISLRTGVIRDHNQHSVPDGTPVRFTLSQGESGLVQQLDAMTSGGVATAAFRLDRDGLIEIRAVSEPALISDTIQLDVTREGATVIIITPTAEPATPQPTATQAPPTPTLEPSPLVTNTGYPNFFGWLMVLLVMASGVGVTYWLASQIVDSRWAVRWSLLVLVGGLVTYNYLALGFPWGDLFLDGRGMPAFLQAVLTGQALGFGVGWFWRLAAESGDQAQ